MRRLSLALAALLLVAGCGMDQDTVSIGHPDAPPRHLSDWGFLKADGRWLEVRGGSIPYELNTPLFSDYAHKLRTVWMVGGTTARMSADGEIDFPVNSILSKTFFYPRAAGHEPGAPRVLRTNAPLDLDKGTRLSLLDNVLVETRLLVRYADGWRAYPYVWNATQDDAILEIAGDARRIELVSASDAEALTYLVPDANQCAGCHTPDHSAGALSHLGPQAWQLDRRFEYADGPGNQLEHWQAAGILEIDPGVAAAAIDWTDAAAPLEQRARAYLDANCAHCHNARGAADTSALHLNIEAPVDRHYGVCKTPVAVGRGSGDRLYDIYPGRPADSILVFRMEHSDPAIAMPELGRSVVHAEGVALVSDWIASLNGEC